MNVIKFRYAKLRKLVKVFGSLLLVVGFYIWRIERTEALLFYLPVFAIGGAIIFLLLYGSYIFDRFRLDDTGLTIKRRFHESLRFDFKDIKQIDEKGGLFSNEKEHVATLHASDDRTYRIIISDIKYGDMLLSFIEQGTIKARSIGQ